MKTLLALFPAFLISTCCFGYSRPNHEAISICTNLLLLQHHKISDSALACNGIAFGSKHEDQPYRWLNKLANQHFYRYQHQDAIKNHRHFMDRFDRLDKMVLRKMKKEHTGKKYWRKIGMLLHYIQDMSCPPHVVPVYHGAGDGFDVAPFNNVNMPDLAQYHYLSGLSPWALLDSMSSITFRRLKEPVTVMVDGKPENTTWEFFWQPGISHSIKGFGDYGPAGKKNYGQTSFEVKYKGKKSIVTVEKSAYDTFRRKQFELAAAGSYYAVCYYIDRQKSKRDRL